MKRHIHLFAWAMLASWLHSPGRAQDDLPPPVVANIKYDSFGRVVAADGKRKVPCPVQDDRTAVLLMIGQSNAANYATRPYRSRHRKNVVNYFDGKCYLASSPLLGADGPWGEYWTELANRLISSETYGRVILVSSAIGGTSIDVWRADHAKPTGLDLNAMLMGVLDSVRQRYCITHVLWHQGEADTDMPIQNYRQGFHSLVASLRNHAVNAPVFISVTSAAGGNPPVVQAQKSLPDPALGIFAGVNTDELVKPEERNVTGHFGAVAQEKVINAWLTVLTAHANDHPH